ncbi:MAG TPA: biotin--[acetyl-CoA-carboxylase] ligase [Allosphingosinicella sp.]|jgi:BirA family biotin operon repressor/biotin-[acetyl-CoA-carboxylase] ligase
MTDFEGTHPLIRTVVETGSTNDDVASLARAGAPEGSWLRAGRQTGGRGRQGRGWDSPPGNLHASTLVRLAPGDPPAPSLALVAAVALHEVAAAYAGEAEVIVKWPNDLLAGGAKLAGILLEREGEAVVIGFGVNLAHVPPDLGRPATSLVMLAGAAPDPAAFLDALAAAFARWLGRWRSEGLAAIRRQWVAVAHPPGTALAVEGAQGLFEGLDESGALRLRLADGSTRLIHAGDVFLI